MVTAISAEQLAKQIEDGDFVAVRNLKFESNSNKIVLSKTALDCWYDFHDLLRTNRKAFLEIPGC